MQHYILFHKRNHAVAMKSLDPRLLLFCSSLDHVINMLLSDTGLLLVGQAFIRGTNLCQTRRGKTKTCYKTQTLKIATRNYVSLKLKTNLKTTEAGSRRTAES